MTDPRPVCRRCAMTVGPGLEGEPDCTNCRKAGFRFEAAIRLGPYEGRLRDAILRMKTPSGEAIAGKMGRVLLESKSDRLREANANAVVPVPLHWRRHWSRGHNQSRELGEEVAKGLSLPFMPGCLRRIRHTPQQLQPSAAARRENVRGAFRLSRRASVTGKRILLVDDVMTTGSTANEAARTLLQAGAAAVVVAVLARR